MRPQAISGGEQFCGLRRLWLTRITRTEEPVCEAQIIDAILFLEKSGIFISVNIQFVVAAKAVLACTKPWQTEQIALTAVRASASSIPAKHSG